MSISQIEFDKIVQKLSLQSGTNDYRKIQNSIEIVNIAFLKIATNELKNLLDRPSNQNRDNLFDRLMGRYNQRVREHEVMYLLMHIIETTLRAKAASVISKKFSAQGQDNWWHDMRSIDRRLIDPVMLGAKSAHKLNIQPNKMTTFNFFDSITFNQLLNIYKDFWTDFRNDFDAKTYKGYALASLSKQQFEAKLRHIRSARNDVSHHKPIHHGSGRRRQDLINDIELILCHLGYNLDEAINNIDPTHNIIQLRYT
jgi:hypothetical protein